MAAGPAALLQRGGSAAADAAVSPHYRYHRGELCFQLLGLPVTDCSTDYPSMRDFATGYLLAKMSRQPCWAATAW